MSKTPNSIRKHVVILGNTNAGKSTLFNALTGQKRSIVSSAPGTTTDPVNAAMELVPFGPIVLVDTAGFNDKSPLGKKRLEHTQKAIRRADSVLYVADSDDLEEYTDFKKKNIPHLLIFTKEGNKERAEKHPDALTFSGNDSEEISLIQQRLSGLLESQGSDNETIIGGLLPSHSTVLMVIPIDSAAPRGRLILPQVQLIRDCLDHGIICVAAKDTELEQALKKHPTIDLVVTDSQAFGYVDSLVPKSIPLTSFSILLANQKGDFNTLLKGAYAAGGLKDNDKILMLEGCTHNLTHSDIGRVKIPGLLQAKTGKKLNFDYYSGYDFPDSKDLSKYAMAIQCGGCMLNKREITNRAAEMKDLPVTNYGMILAYLNGILERGTEIFTL